MMVFRRARLNIGVGQGKALYWRGLRGRQGFRARRGRRWVLNDDSCLLCLLCVVQARFLSGLPFRARPHLRSPPLPSLPVRRQRPGPARPALGLGWAGPGLVLWLIMADVGVSSVPCQSVSVSLPAGRRSGRHATATSPVPVASRPQLPTRRRSEIASHSPPSCRTALARHGHTRVFGSHARWFRLVQLSSNVFAS